MRFISFISILDNFYVTKVDYVMVRMTRPHSKTGHRTDT